MEVEGVAAPKMGGLVVADARMTGLVEARTAVLQDQITVLVNAQAASTARDEDRWRALEGALERRFQREAEVQARNEEGWRVTQESSVALVGLQDTLLSIVAQLGRMGQTNQNNSGPASGGGHRPGK